MTGMLGFGYSYTVLSAGFNRGQLRRIFEIESRFHLRFVTGMFPTGSFSGKQLLSLDFSLVKLNSRYYDDVTLRKVHSFGMPAFNAARPAGHESENLIGTKNEPVTRVHGLNNSAW